MGKYTELIREGISDTINRIFPYEEDSSKSFNILLKPKAVDRITKLSFLALFLSFNIGTGLTMGFQPDLLIPTGLSPNRFMFVMFIGVYAYFSKSDRIYESTYRTCYEMDLVDREDEEVKNKVDPHRNEEVIEAINDICDDSLGQVEDTKTRTTIEEIRRRIISRFEGEEYVNRN